MRYPENVFDDRLKRCPFCGAHAVVAGPEFQDDGKSFSIDCDGNFDDNDYCGASQQADTLDEAIRMWNRRTE